MNAPHKIALTPASLATDGEQGEGAKAESNCRAQHSPPGLEALFLARVAIDAARVQLDAYAQSTDEPHTGTVEAADLLDAARAALDEAP